MVIYPQIYMLDRLYLIYLLPLINRKDIRTARKWCRANGLNVYKDMTGEFIYKIEFDLAYDLPFFKTLQLKYGEKWKEAYSQYKSGSIIEKIVFSDDTPKKRSYNPKGKVAKKILVGF